MLNSSKGKKDNFNFVFLRTINILTMIKRTEYLILFTRRRSLGIIALLCFNHQTIIRYVGRNGFELGYTILESVLSVVSSRFTVFTLYCDFLHTRRFCANLPAPLLDLPLFLGFLI